jgi:hypothetical protein
MNHPYRGGARRDSKRNTQMADEHDEHHDDDFNHNNVFLVALVIFALVFIPAFFGLYQLIY